jgi:nicotinamidase/pyrazinamidase
MGAAVFWDVDTQVDFMEPGAALYIPGAELLVDNLRVLTEFARANSIRVIGSVDYHDPSDAELSVAPDFHDTFPPHCLKGTEGQRKIAATAPLDPLWIDSEPWSREELAAAVLAHSGELIFRKQRFDVFSNPNVDTVLEVLDPSDIVLYGVALDVCDAHAIEGLLARGRAIHLVEDAVRAIDAGRGERLLADWTNRGVVLVTTSDVLTSYHESPTRA